LETETTRPLTLPEEPDERQLGAERAAVQRVWPTAVHLLGTVFTPGARQPVGDPVPLAARAR